MHNETYDEYIRSILGYPMQSNSMYNTNINTNTNTGYDMSYIQNNELEKCYPEIYKIIYPMVRTACSGNVEPINEQTIENMTDDIYSAIESNTSIDVTINLTNDVQRVNTIQQNRAADVKIKESSEKRENRQINRGLRDLIKILILRELIGRPGNRPPTRPPRPPFPGGPGPGRPPIMPRYYNNDLYEL